MFTFLFSDRSPKWSKVRKTHLINEPFCQSCGRSRDLEVHHIIPVHLDPSKELDATNLITLCHGCHFMFGHLLDYKSWNVNVVEDSKNFLSKVKKRPYHETFSQVSNVTNDFISKIISWYNRSFGSR